MTSNPSSAVSTYDVVLIGGGVMSATLGVLLRQLEPNLSIALFGRLDDVALESSNGWNNAGTGHSALCELNYTPLRPDGNVDISKAVNVNEAFQVSRQFWSYLVESGQIASPRDFLNPIPHMSFVWGAENTDFLRRRHTALQEHPLFSGMSFSTDEGQLRQWMPLVMHDRKPGEPLAATWHPAGTDVNFGALTRRLVGILKGRPGFELHLAMRWKTSSPPETMNGTCRCAPCMAGRSARCARNSCLSARAAVRCRCCRKAAYPKRAALAAFPSAGSSCAAPTPISWRATTPRCTARLRSARRPCRCRIWIRA